MGKNSGFGSGLNNPDHISEGLKTIFGVKILKLFNAVLGSGIRDGKNSDPGSGIEKIWIRDKHPGSATLIGSLTATRGVD
jgi:hypothetical protein